MITVKLKTQNLYLKLSLTATLDGLNNRKHAIVTIILIIFVKQRRDSDLNQNSLFEVKDKTDNTYIDQLTTELQTTSNIYFLLDY